MGLRRRMLPKECRKCSQQWHHARKPAILEYRSHILHFYGKNGEAIKASIIGNTSPPTNCSGMCLMMPWLSSRASTVLNTDTRPNRR
ncbi:hypothetical protein ACHAXN_000398 [Cyclotella atomus]